MIEVKGFIKGKHYEGPLSCEDLINLFELPIKTSGKKKVVELVLCENLRKKDKLNGGFKFPKGQGIPTKFTGILDTDTVEIKYYKTKNTRPIQGGGSEVFYTPNKLRFLGQQMAFTVKGKGISKSDEMEHLVFFLLHGQCANSPLRVQGMEKVYKLNDTVEQAKEKVLKDGEFYKVFNRILNEDSDREITTKAYGLGIDGVATMEPVEIRAALVELAKKDVKSFVTKYESKVSVFKGLLKAAITDGDIFSQPVSANTLGWYWSQRISEVKHQVSTPSLICQIPNHGDPFEAFSNHVMTIWDTFFPILNEAKKLKTAGSKIDEMDINVLMGTTPETIKTPEPTVGSGRHEFTLENIDTASGIQLYNECVYQEFLEVQENVVYVIKKGKQPEEFFRFQSSDHEKEIEAFLLVDKRAYNLLKSKIRGRISAKKVKN